MPEQLTELERSVLGFLIEYLRTNTYQPSIREIGTEFGIRSTKTVSELLQSLANKGWIARDPSRSRGVRLLGFELRNHTVCLPVYDSADGTVVTGQLELDRRIVAEHGAFLMAMNGDHLSAEGVREGDLLVIEPVDLYTIEDGDLVIVQTGGSTTARRCMRRGSDFVLDPVRRGEVALTLSLRGASGAIRGRVTGVVRRLRQPVRDERAQSVAIHAV